MKVSKKCIRAKNDKKSYGIWLRSRKAECSSTGQKLNIDLQHLSNRGNPVVTLNSSQVKNQLAVAESPKIDENESTCVNEHECWIVASKESTKSDLKLCLQKTSTSHSETVIATSQSTQLQQSKNGSTGQGVEPCQAGCDVQCKQITLRSATQQRGIKRKKQKLSYRKTQRQKKMKNGMAKNKNLSPEVKDLLTTQEKLNEKGSIRKKKIITKRKSSTAKVKDEEECAIESMLGDVFIAEPDNISSSSVLIRDVLMYDKEEDVPTVSDKVVIENNSMCHDVELLLPESITYLQNQCPNDTVGNGDESQDLKYGDLLGSPNYGIKACIDHSIGISDNVPAEECGENEYISSNSTEHTEYQLSHSSSCRSTFEDTKPAEPKENESVRETSSITDTSTGNQVVLQNTTSGLELESNESSNQQEDKYDQMIDLTTALLSGEDNTVTEDIISSQSSGIKYSQPKVQMNCDCLGNVVFTNIIICPSDLYMQGEEITSNDELQCGVGIQYVQLNKEFNTNINNDQPVEIAKGRHSISAVNEVLRDDTDCGNDQNDNSLGKTCQLVIAESEGMVHTNNQESESSSCGQTEFITSGNSVGAEDKNIAKIREMTCVVKLFRGNYQMLGDDADDASEKVDSKSEQSSCQSETVAEDEPSVEQCLENRCEDPSGTHEENTVNDSSKTMEENSPEESEAEIFAKPTSTLYSFSLLQEYSSGESDNELSPEAATDDSVHCDGNCGGVDIQPMDPTEDRCANNYENEGKDVKVDDLEDLDKLSVHCESSDLFSSDDESSSDRETPVKGLSTMNSESNNQREQQTADGEQIPVQTLHKSQDYAKDPQLISKVKPMVKPLNKSPLKRRVVEVRSRHYPSFQSCKNEFKSNHRIVVNRDPHQLILNLVNNGLLVQAWREIVHYGLCHEVDTRCLEDMVVKGCMMMTDNAWQMAMEILTELKYNVSCNLPILCFKLIKNLCNMKEMNRAMVIFDYIPFPLNCLVPMEILDQLLDGLMSTSKWKAARDVVGRLLCSGLKPQDYVLQRILKTFYDDSDSQGIIELLRLLQKSAMQRAHPIYQDALRFLRRLQLNTRCDYHDDPVQSSKLKKLLEPQNIKELISAIWDCPNGFHLGRMCTTFFEVWSVEASCSSALQQEICAYLTRGPQLQAVMFADFIRELDKTRKICPAFREACTDLLNGLLLEALALDNKKLALRIIFPSMESYLIPIYDKGLASLTDLQWNAGSAARATARRLFNLRCQNGFLGSRHVRPFELLIQSTSSIAEIFFTIEKFLFSHKQLYNKRTYHYDIVRVVILHGPRPKGFNLTVEMENCIHRVKHVLETAFEPPLIILRIYPFTNKSPKDVLVVAYHSIQDWLKLKANSSKQDPYQYCPIPRYSVAVK
ncbi:uncharacterized protein LOC117105754 isoform X2 [Anneissia japonica]|uniref:uncharacterized protein LOC117105754 isoform X2 n=1 Tax=Anneissia japonica TaxID=1529436 RepID=UPI00142559A2|nr:uncharacterized protein LOC117105754 isoform X2 [Anneissia japonica]